jgi:hypothetical protein
MGPLGVDSGRSGGQRPEWVLSARTGRSIRSCGFLQSGRPELADGAKISSGVSLGDSTVNPAASSLYKGPNG